MTKTFKQQRGANPARKRVSLKNFTGTIIRNSNGTVTVKGRGKVVGKTRANPKKCAARNPHRLTGHVAIAYAEKHGGTLKKFSDPTERALKRVSIEKAKRVAREDPRLIYMDVKHGNA